VKGEKWKIENFPSFPRRDPFIVADNQTRVVNSFNLSVSSP
jgi:hypothetical protein